MTLTPRNVLVALAVVLLSVLSFLNLPSNREQVPASYPRTHNHVDYSVNRERLRRLRSADKEQEIRALDAHEFFNLSNEADQKKAAHSVDYLVLTADAKNMRYNLYLSLVRKRGTFIMVGLSPLFIVPCAVHVRGSLIGSIQDIKDMLELASKKNVRLIVEKLPMSKVNEGRVRYRVVLEN